jgi:rubrerythrin
MNIFDCAIKMGEETQMYYGTLAAAATSNEIVDLFNRLAEAERAHHDALVEMKGYLGPQKSQFKVLQGRACLFKTSPGQA